MRHKATVLEKNFGKDVGKESIKNQIYVRLLGDQHDGGSRDAALDELIGSCETLAALGGELGGASRRTTTSLCSTTIVSGTLACVVRASRRG